MQALEPTAPETYARSLAKALTWRAVGTLILILLSYAFTRSGVVAVSIGLIDIVANVLLFVIHERVWGRLSWGRARTKDGTMRDRQGRSLAKTLSWRVLGSGVTFLLAFALTNRPAVSGALAVTDALANLAVYYIHERVWDRVEWGKRKPGHVSFIRQFGRWLVRAIKE